jgi:hypothetical protein
MAQSELWDGPDEFAAPWTSTMAMTENIDLLRGIGAPATRALVEAGYTSIDQLAGVPVAVIAALHGVGPRAIRILAETLAERGCALG